MRKRIVRHVGYLQELYRDARSAGRKILSVLIVIFHNIFTYVSRVLMLTTLAAHRTVIDMFDVRKQYKSWRSSPQPRVTSSVSFTTVLLSTFFLRHPVSLSDSTGFIWLTTEKGGASL